MKCPSTLLPIVRKLVNKPWTRSPLFDGFLFLRKSNTTGIKAFQDSFSMPGVVSKNSSSCDGHLICGHHTPYFTHMTKLEAFSLKYLKQSLSQSFNMFCTLYGIPNLCLVAQFHTKLICDVVSLPNPKVIRRHRHSSYMIFFPNWSYF